MKHYDLFSINYAAVLGIIFLVVFLQRNTHISKGIKKKFLILIALEIIEMITYSIELELAVLDHPTVWRILLSVIGYSLRPFFLYIILIISLRAVPNKKRDIILMIPALINVLAVSTAFFSDISFSYTQENVFERGPLGLVPHFVVIVYLVLLVVCEVRNTVRGKSFELLILYMITFVIASSIVIESVFQLKSIGRTSLVLCTLFYYMFFQTVEYTSIIVREDEQIKGLMNKNRLDPMTGLLNKEAFSEICRESLENNTEESISFLFIDLDHFKRINDTLGHIAGDNAIINSSNRIRETFRKGDFLCRFGGDEFCVCLRGISYDELCERLDVICRNLQQECWNQSHTKSIIITSSIGAVYCENATDISYDELVFRADKAVYEAKNAGRNKYVIDGGFDNDTGTEQ